VCAFSESEFISHGEKTIFHFANLVEFQWQRTAISNFVVLPSQESRILIIQRKKTNELIEALFGIRHHHATNALSIFIIQLILS
jgi:hypothetical protein